MRVIKAFNNNAVLGRTDDGQEVIVMGKGVGFKKYPKDPINLKTIEKTFILKSQADTDSFHDLFDKIPFQDVELAGEVIELGKELLPFELNDSLLITLSDHISYMLRRIREGLTFSSPLLWEIKTIYPDEYAAGRKAADFLRRKTGLEIPDSEEAFIALHFANAHLDTTDMEETILLTKIIDQVLEIVQYHYHIKISETSYEFTRFAAHLRLFVKRCLSGGASQDNTALLAVIKAKYQKDYRCALKIKKYLETIYSWKISEDELLYLSLHLNRIGQKHS